MIAKLITTAQTREGAISKMKRALEEFIIEGVKTTIPFHLKLMSDPAYVQGRLYHKVYGRFFHGRDYFQGFLIHQLLSPQKEL